MNNRLLCAEREGQRKRQTGMRAGTDMESEKERETNRERVVGERVVCVERGAGGD